MIFRTALITSCLALVSCGGQSAVATSERLEQVENNCGMLAAQAAFETGDTAPTNFCYCMVQLLEDGPDMRVDAISQTLAVIVDEHLKTGDPFSAIAAQMVRAANMPDASDRSKSLGIGIQMVQDLSTEVDTLAKRGQC